jgi:hypothetical protein
MGAFILAVLLPAVAVTVSADPERVSAGKWGGRGAQLEVTAKGGSIELDCAHGTLDEPLQLGAEGTFDVKGTFVLERAGPSREDGGGQGPPVRYRGRLQGDTLSLTIVRDGEPTAELAQVKVTRGQAGRLRKCL